MSDGTTILKENDGCLKYAELITACADGELATEEQILLDSHLETCDKCSNAYELEVATKQFLYSKVPPLQTPWRVRADIIEKIRIESGVQPIKRPSFLFPWWKPTLAIGGAFAIVLLSSIFFFKKQQPIIADGSAVKQETSKAQSSQPASPIASVEANQSGQIGRAHV